MVNEVNEMFDKAINNITDQCGEFHIQTAIAIEIYSDNVSSTHLISARKIRQKAAIQQATQQSSRDFPNPNRVKPTNHRGVSSRPNHSSTPPLLTHRF